MARPTERAAIEIRPSSSAARHCARPCRARRGGDPPARDSLRTRARGCRSIAIPASGRGTDREPAHVGRHDDRGHAIGSASSSVRHATTTNPVIGVPLFVMNDFDPSITQLPPSSRAFVRSAGVRSAPWLREAEPREHLARGDRREPPLSLFRVPVPRDHPRGQSRGDRDGDRDARVRPSQLLDHERPGDGVRSEASVLLGDRDAADPEFPELLHDVEGKFLVFVSLAGTRRDLLGGELPDEVADLLLLGRDRTPSDREYRLPVRPLREDGAMSDTVTVDPLEAGRRRTPAVRGPRPTDSSRRRIARGVSSLRIWRHREVLVVDRVRGRVDRRVRTCLRAPPRAGEPLDGRDDGAHAPTGVRGEDGRFRGEGVAAPRRAPPRGSRRPSRTATSRSRTVSSSSTRNLQERSRAPSRRRDRLATGRRRPARVRRSAARKCWERPGGSTMPSD